MGLNAEETVVLRPNIKDLPFPGSRKLYSKKNNNLFQVSSLKDVGNMIEVINKGKKIKNIVVDDFTHLLGQRVINDTPISGFKKWNELAMDTVYAMFGNQENLREDLYIYFMVHTTETIDADGARTVHMQTPGKLLDNLVKPPSYFTFVLHTDVREIDGTFSYRFLTNMDSSGKEAKSPEGCFDLFIDNNLGIVRNRIEAYMNGEETKNN